MGLVGMSQVVPELVGITGQSVAIPDIYELQWCNRKIRLSAA